MTIENTIITYLIAINALAFLLYGIDKYKAIKGKWRIPERKLLGVAIAGGNLGSLLAIWTFKHKTLHKKFSLGIPFILCIQIGLILFYLKGC